MGLEALLGSGITRNKLRGETFRGHRCKNCYEKFTQNADIYVGYTKENHRVTQCEHCHRYNIMLVNGKTPHLITKKEEKTMRMRQPLTKKNAKLLLVGVALIVSGFIGAVAVAVSGIV